MTDAVRQPFGLVYGGVYSAVAETVASAMTYAAVSGDGMVAMGQSNTANFLRPITAGQVHATGTVIHRGRTTWVWDVECADDAGRVAATRTAESPAIARRRPMSIALGSHHGPACCRSKAFMDA